jgi:8-oxo-dGTP diphosphatase
MPVSDQKINPVRYQLIPRVLIFVMRPEAVLLLKLLPRDGKVTRWTGRYNGPGGHVERGEDLLSAARRELLEETGLTADLSHCGTLFVDTGQDVGIGLFIFRGANPSGELHASREGLPEWLPLDRLTEYPLVEDVSILLEHIRQMPLGAAPFSARSFYDENEQLRLVFAS